MFSFKDTKSQTDTSSANGKSEVIRFASYSQRLEIIKSKLNLKVSKAEHTRCISGKM